jgi:heme a synthase
VRKYALLTLALMLSEALIGAGLVLFELVAHNASMKRALSMALHMSNTFLLLGAMALCALSVQAKELPRLRDAVRTPWALVALLSVFVTGIAGAIAALGDTLFPASSLREGMMQDLNPASHWLLRIRASHPALAVATAACLLLFALSARRKATEPLKRFSSLWSTVLMSIVGLQTTLGIANLLLLAPIPIQLAHLVLADSLFVATLLCVVCSHRAPGKTEVPALSPFRNRARLEDSAP